MTKNETLKSSEAAQLLSVSRSTFQRMIEDKKVKSIHAYNPLLKRQKLEFLRSEIEKLLFN